MAFAIVALLFMMDYALSSGKWPWSTNPAANTNEPVVCTDDAKLCPDGSYVGRTGPNCEFTACPETNTNVTVNTNSGTNTNSTTDETTDWKTYTDNVNNFSIKYPPTWSYRQSEEIANTSVTFTKPGSDIIQPAISIRPMTVEQLKTELRQNLATIGGSISTQVGGVTANGFTYTGAIGADYDYYYVVKGENTFFFFSKKNDIEWQRALTTFSFTDSTADWKTYTSSQFGFSFRYPSNLRIVEGTGHYGNYYPLGLAFFEGNTSQGYWFEVGKAASGETSVLKTFESTYNFSDLSTSVSTLSNVIIGSQTAKHYCGIPGNISYCTAMFVYNNALFTFNYREPATLPSSILSTFTFTQ